LSEITPTKPSAYGVTVAQRGRKRPTKTDIIATQQRNLDIENHIVQVLSGKGVYRQQGAFPRSQALKPRIMLAFVGLTNGAKSQTCNPKRRPLIGRQQSTKGKSRLRF
jgi:hypothetical protein